MAVGKDGRPRSAPASPRRAAAADSSSNDAILLAAPLTKVEYARLSVESDNFQWARSYKQAATARRSYQAEWKARTQQSLMEQALFTKERVRTGMRRAIEQSREEASNEVTAQRERLAEIERKRNELRAAHAAYGKELHDRQYGSDAALKRSLTQEAKGKDRQELAAKGASLAAERLNELTAGAAARSASVERVKQHSGVHVIKGVFNEEVSARKAAVQAKREHSAEAQAAIDAMKEHRRQQAEESRERVLALEDQVRRGRQADVEQKRFRAQLVRNDNHVVNVAADQVRQETARRRKNVHDYVRSDKLVEDAPVPLLAAGAGGIAGSRKAAVAAAFAPRPSAPKLAAAESAAAPAADQLHTSTKAAGYIFDPGPTGITLQEVAAGVIVGEVATGSAAMALKVPVGGLLLAVNGHPVYGLSRIGVNKAMTKANWPMTLLVSPYHQYTFEGETPTGKKAAKGRPLTITPAGFTLKDTQNGVIIDKVLPNSPACSQGMLAGSLLVTVNGSQAPGMNKADVGPMLKERPLTIQTVPRDVAYLFRPKGPPRQKVVAVSQAELDGEPPEATLTR